MAGDVVGGRVPAGPPVGGAVFRVVLRAAVLTGGVVVGILLLGGHQAHAAGGPVDLAAPARGGAPATHSVDGLSRPRLPGLPGTAPTGLPHPPVAVAAVPASPPRPVPRIVPVQLVDSAISRLPIPPVVTTAVAQAATTPLQPLAAAVPAAALPLSPATTQAGRAYIPAGAPPVSGAQPSAGAPPVSLLPLPPAAEVDQGVPGLARLSAGAAHGAASRSVPLPTAPRSPHPANSPCGTGTLGTCRAGAGGPAAATEAGAHPAPRPLTARRDLPSFVPPMGLGAARPAVSPD